MQIFKFIFLIISVYIYIYNPIFQLFGFGIIKVLLPFSIVFVFLKGPITFISLFKDEIILTFLISLYVFLTVLWGDSSGLVVAYSHLIWFLESFLIPFFLVLYFKDFFEKYSWEKLIINVGIVASLITLFLIFNSDLNVFIRDSIIVDTLDTVSGGAWDFRGFSIAESSSYGYGVVQGLILGICLLSLKYNKLYFFSVIVLFIAVIFNARTGVVPIFVSLLLMFLFKQIKPSIFFWIFAVIVIGYWFFNYSSFAFNNETSLEWGLSIFKDTQDFARGSDNESNYTILLNEMLFLPNNIWGIIFGEGKDIFLIGDKTSDIGYVLQIYRGGFVYLFFIFLFLWKMIKRNLKHSTNTILISLFVLTIIFVNFKGNAFFISNSFVRLFGFYYVYSILKSYGFIGSDKNTNLNFE